MHHHLSSSSSSSSSCFTYHALFLFLLHFAPFSSSSFSVSYYHIPTSISSSFLLPLLLPPPCPPWPLLVAGGQVSPGSGSQEHQYKMQGKDWTPTTILQPYIQHAGITSIIQPLQTVLQNKTNIHVQPFCNHKDQQ